MKREETKIIHYDDHHKELHAETLEFTIRSPNRRKKVLQSSKNRISFGSGNENDFQIDDPFVSRRHCRIDYLSIDPLLIDLGSTNGILLDGEPIDKVTLPRKSLMTIGKTMIAIRRLEKCEKIAAVNVEKMGGLIGVSDSMKEIFALILRVAPTEATICITGESGTGKELVACSIHDMSDRKGEPFVAINCGAIPPTIIESELFGHERGAFTGAASTHRGVFEQANGGTLFLDEIGEMPPDLQTRLLRTLETRTIRRIGGHRDIPVDVRIIAATNQDLKKRVAESRFREDLFFRLYIIPIHIPPLRERRDDIEHLANYFVRYFAKKGKTQTISSRAMAQLMTHSWPGNVRELKNTIQRAVIMNDGGTITARHIQITELVDPHAPRVLPLINQEKEAIFEALRRHRGNQTKASRTLGISRTTLGNKIKKYEIDLSRITL